MKNRLTALPLALFILLSLIGCVPRPAAGVLTEANVLIGTYTRTEGHVDGKADGIYRATVDLRTGAIGAPQLINTVTNPSFLALHRGNDKVYAVSELAQDGEPTGFLHAYRKTGGQLEEVAKLPSDGKAPCHVAIDPTREYVAVANYVGGVAKLYKIEDDGSMVAADKFVVTEAAKAGRSSWLHSTNFSPADNLVVVADKGLDKVWMFTLDREAGKLVPHEQTSVELDEGAGPRHAVWSTDGKMLYVINELGNTVDVLTYDRAEDRLSRQQTISTLPEGFTGESYCADIRLSKNGLFLYGSNRGHDSIASFAVDKDTGRLSATGHVSTHGTFPRNFTLTPDDNFLLAANQNSSNVTVFSVDSKTGKLTYTDQSFDVPTPVCLVWE